jgi:ABC-type nickel/cobalt efflux system permease component RcnA
LAALLLAAWCLFPCRASADPMPDREHHRKIVVSLAPEPLRQELIVTVHYRLEVNASTASEDMIPFKAEVRYDRYPTREMALNGEFTRIYAPILAGNLVATINGQPLKFLCQERLYTKYDENGAALGHLRCDFVFRAAVPLRFPPRPTELFRLSFREGNYELESGKILLSLADSLPPTPGPGVPWSIQALTVKAPDQALQAKPAVLQAPSDNAKLRELEVSFVCVQVPNHRGAAAIAPPAQSSATPGEASDLFDLFLTSEHGIAVVLLLSALIGAAHALTPGHGKTLVAAYLVGQRGTVGHAFILGLVTTITHTGVVLLIALGLLFVNEEARQQVANALGLALGIALVCLGLWLLLQRLAGRADHFHLPGHGHHHHDHPHHHEPAAGAGSKPLQWWGLLVMGMTGGIAPCWDAVAMLVLAIGMNLLWLALPMLLAFSAGLASVLVLIGILVVHARKLLDARWSQSRAVRLLPILSAVFIAGMGILVCYQGTQRLDGSHHSAAAGSRP